MKQSVWKTAETKQKSDEEHSEQYARLMETLMAAQGTTLNAINSNLGNEPIGELLRHIYKLLICATDDSQKIWEKINVHGSDKDIVDGVTSSKDVLSDDSRQKIEEKDKTKLLGSVQSLITLMTQQQQQQQRNNFNGGNRSRWQNHKGKPIKWDEHLDPSYSLLCTNQQSDAERVNNEGVIFQGNRNDFLAVASCPILFKRVDFQARQNSSPAVALQYSQRVDFQASQISSPAVAPFISMGTDSLATLNSSPVVATVFNSQRLDLQELMKFFGTDINTSEKVPFSNQTPSSQQRVITSQLLKFLPSWEQIGARKLVIKRLAPNWRAADSEANLMKVSTKQVFYGSVEEMKLMQSEIQKKLQQGIITMIDPYNMALQNRVFLIAKKESSEKRKILDFSMLNEELAPQPFKMEDVKVAKQLIQRLDYAVTLDIHSAFSHVPVDPELTPYLAFNFKEETYAYIAMPFGIKHAPKTFHKLMRPVIGYIRTNFNLRRVVYCDDLHLLEQDQTVLKAKSVQVLQFLRNLGWIINECKYILDPSLTFKFLGWMFDIVNMTLLTTEKKRTKLILELNKWIKVISNRKPVKPREVARLIEAQLTTNASVWGWGGVLQLPNEEEIMVHGVRARNWRLTSSNQRETATILCCLRRFESTLHNRQIQALEILTDNTTTAYNIRRPAAAGPLVKLTQAILEWTEANKNQLSTTYLQGIANKVADSLCRLNRAGDYFIHKLKAQRIMKQLEITATIDAFSTRSNRVVQRYCSPRIDSRTVARDGLKIN
ncbi:MAG: putative Transposon Ty3-G Gag-Pol polyprotein [Streblomastix strix]|uniref:Putative Transposon Ty3-G Gag-Pol polyprotein n=1 Tax=Streblomastix strix TaxID=222440 RepID=A0A5J4VY81_9EUKA|nr:MAG: putative Transposon Ty3-G Gag-Pol polyprotein [Streblomastix strix]